LRDDAAGLAELGIEIGHGHGAMLHYQRQPGVFFQRGQQLPMDPPVERCESA